MQCSFTLHMSAASERAHQHCNALSPESPLRMGLSAGEQMELVSSDGLQPLLECALT